MPRDPYIYVLVGLFGLAVGSFLNVLIYRIPRQIPVVFQRSICPHCRMPIPFYHNLPVLSYMILLGRCCYCHHPISPRYPMVEIISAALFIFLYHLDGLSGIFFVHAFFASALVVIFFIDLEFQIIPDVITLPGMFIGLAAAIFLDSPGPVNSLLGLVVGGLTLLGVGALGEWLFRKEAMGGGDIKMAAMMGAFVGWQKVLLIFVAGAAIGMVVSLVWMIFSPKVRRGGLIPFGPFLAMAALIVLIYGERIIRYYVETFLLT